MENNNNLEKDYYNKKRYPALRTVAGVYIVYSIIIGISSFIAVINFLSKEEWWLAFSALLVGSILILVFIAVSESIKVFIDIEYNTRRALKPKDINNQKQNKKDNIIPLVKIEEEPLAIIKDPNKVKKLNNLIQIQKESLFNSKNKDGIIRLTTDLCESKESVEVLLLYYKKTYNYDLLDELKSLTSNYDGIRSYLNPFIVLGIVKEKFPHERI